MRKASGFTLIELLVVIAIIAILAAILFPVFAKARAKSWEASCLSNMKQITLGILMYNQDYDGFLPMQVYPHPEITAGAWRNVYWSYAVDPYIKGGIEGAASWTHPKSIWRCPGMKSAEAWYGGAYSHYGINHRISRAAAIVRDSEIKYPANTMLITEGMYQSAAMALEGRHYGWYRSWGYSKGSDHMRYDHDGRANVGFCDGHAKTGTVGQWNNGEWKMFADGRS
jgi:prepilin-type N-terminal cleavage/methylation domain-containing protein/prepilin-type processing-associated H-X9-DG protein